MIDKDKHIFSSDRPILGASEDRLERSKFSNELAQSISKWTEKDSLVVAIYGRWGDGKTSVKNMVKEVFDREKTPMYMEFSPWQWANEDHITEAFFKELAGKLNSSYDDARREVAKKLLEYAEYLELGNELIGKFKKIAEKIMVLTIGGVGIISIIIPQDKKQWIIFITLALVLCTLALDEIIWSVKWIARWRNIRFKESKNLEERKADLVISLLKLKTTMVVFIDDIDRLSKVEIKTLFRLIKANADFPNIVYLALFQRDIVEQSLEKDEAFKGSDYLKKIVQVGFNLPRVPVSDIHNILFKELDRLLAESGLNSKFEKGRWNEIFVEGLSCYFANLRDVNRFISTFSFHLGVLKSDSSYEINFIDLVGLEVLRQFEPAVYETIFFAKKLLTSSSSSGHSRNSGDAAAKKQIEDILSQGPAENREAIKNIIRVLFPNAQWAWGSNYHYSVGNEEFIKLRVNHPNRFDRYFSLFLPDDEIKQSEFDYILSVTNNESEFFSALMQYYDQGRLSVFIEKFAAYRQTISKRDAVPFISVMLRLGEMLSDEYEGYFSIPPVTHVKHIIHWYFKKADFTDDERRDVYWNILESSRAIYLPIILLWDELERRKIKEYPDHYLLKTIEVEKIRKLLTDKFNTNKNRQEFIKNVHLPRILSIWHWLDKTSARAWFNEYIKDDNNLISFLLSLETKGSASSGYETTINYSIQLAWLQQFFDDIVQLAERVRKLKSNVSLDNEKTIRLFENVNRAEDQFLHPEKYPHLARMGWSEPEE